MKKVLMLLAVIGGAACAVMLMRRQDRGTRATIWQKMQEGMESMPEDFPPRVMFDNIAVVKDNTEQILEMLQERSLSINQEAAEI